MLKRYLKRRDNPWEVIAIALLFFVPGLVLFLQRGPVLFYNTRYRTMRPTVMSAGAAHIFGGSAVLFAAFLVGLYFYARFTADVPKRPPDAASFRHRHAPSGELPLAYGSSRSPIPFFERLRSWWKQS